MVQKRRISDYRKYTLLLNVKEVNDLPRGLKSKLVKSLENNSPVGLFGRIIRDYDEDSRCFCIRIVMGSPYGLVLDWDLLEETIKTAFENYHHDELIRELIGPPTSSNSVFLRPLFVGESTVKARRKDECYHDIPGIQKSEKLSSSTIPLHRSQLSESDLVCQVDFGEDEEQIQPPPQTHQQQDTQSKVPSYHQQIPFASQMPFYNTHFSPFYQQMMPQLFPLQHQLMNYQIPRKAVGYIQIGNIKLDKSVPGKWTSHQIKLVLKQKIFLKDKDVDIIELNGYDLENIVYQLMEGGIGSRVESAREMLLKCNIIGMTFSIAQAICRWCNTELVEYH